MSSAEEASPDAGRSISTRGAEVGVALSSRLTCTAPPLMRNSRLPPTDITFDLIVCQAAFKNFVHPGSALFEMYRVLHAGGTAVIQDMSHDASHADIGHEVKEMGLGGVSSFTTKATLEMLKRRAYSKAQFERLAAESPFGTSQITSEGIGLEVRLERPVA